eukprot:CAMPEP_0181112326 /NCGR_PEP_ID=MMETSP1071-20121207/19758_1 /TAXON_ID=35127 /ORGANISM="Thalassiosira sp., Strain NH16" /LENGTH=90 /DNA_ID=CAMNT_0023196297 /DNA_START=619 /DNA_END=891 /DNA_ORIENTATION=+
MVDDPVMPNTVHNNAISAYHRGVFRGGMGLVARNRERKVLVLLLEDPDDDDDDDPDDAAPFLLPPPPPPPPLPLFHLLHLEQRSTRLLDK